MIYIIGPRRVHSEKCFLPYSHSIRLYSVQWIRCGTCFHPKEKNAFILFYYICLRPQVPELVWWHLSQETFQLVCLVLIKLETFPMYHVLQLNKVLIQECCNWNNTYLSHLYHWGRVTHICVGNLTIIGSDNGLSPNRRQAIIWTNARILLIGL